MRLRRMAANRVAKEDLCDAGGRRPARDDLSSPGSYSASSQRVHLGDRPRRAKIRAIQGRQRVQRNAHPEPELGTRSHRADPR